MHICPPAHTLFLVLNVDAPLPVVDRFLQSQPVRCRHADTDACAWTATHGLLVSISCAFARPDCELTVSCKECSVHVNAVALGRAIAKPDVL